MAFFGGDNPSNFGVHCVPSSKYPRCSDEVEKDVHFDGYICNYAVAGEVIPKGAVLRPSTTTDRQIVQTTLSQDITVLGVAADAVSAAGKNVCMITGGEFQILVTGPVTLGDFLSSSGTTGVSVSTGTVGAPGDFAIAMMTDLQVTTRLIWARYKKAEVF